ncbi:MAG TPA: DUF2800 domain-containing protein, partial [Rhabdochlamydiaceae bacterium]
MEIHCSSLARPMACAGFLSFENLPKFESGAAAEEGTAAGELLERMLLSKDLPFQAKNGVYFNDDMKFYLKPIVEEINANKSGDVLCEQKIDWLSRSGVWIRGKYDISFVRDGCLYVDDLKYGWGIVEVRDNWQLLGYAIGEVIRRGIAFEKIVLRIHQPRPHHEDGSTRVWELSYNELLAYKEKIDSRFEQIVAGYNRLESGKQCKYCAAAPEACPAFNRLFYRALEVSTDFVQDQINENEIAEQLDHAARAQEVLKIKMDSLSQLAISRISSGRIIPGYSQQASYGDRTWKGAVSPEVIKTLTGKDILTSVMLSPAKAEKIGIPKDFVNALVDR